MSEHLTLERLSAVLDEPGADGAAVAHLDECAACQREYEAMSRMRMALSGLPELEAPDGVWAGVEAALPAPPAGSADAAKPPVIELSERRRRARPPTTAGPAAGTPSWTGSSRLWTGPGSATG